MCRGIFLQNPALLKAALLKQGCLFIPPKGQNAFLFFQFIEGQEEEIGWSMMAENQSKEREGNLA